MHGDEAIAHNQIANQTAAAQTAKDQAWAAIKNAFHAKLLEGSLTAYVRRDFPFGRWQPVPADAWRTLRITNWGKGIAEGAGVRFTDLRISQLSFADEQLRNSEQQAGPSTEPAALETAAAEVTVRPHQGGLRLTIDERRGKAIVAGVGEFTGANYRLIALLAETAQQDVQALLPPEDHRYTNIRQLTKRLKMNDESLYRRVSKCRQAFSVIAGAALGHPIPQDLLIENSRSKGFRLNPRIRFVAAKSD
jgi:hypothetical protein